MDDASTRQKKQDYLIALSTTFYPILAADKAGVDANDVDKWRSENESFDTACRRIQQRVKETLQHRLIAIGLGGDGNAAAIIKAIDSVESYLNRTNNSTKIAENKTLETICKMLDCKPQTVVQTIQRRLMDDIKPAKRRVLKDYDETNQTKSKNNSTKNKSTNNITELIKDSVQFELADPIFSESFIQDENELSYN